MNEIDTWNGPVFKRWIDEEEFGSKHMSDFRQVDIITEKQSPTTKDEAKQLKESGESERIVHCEPKHLRQIFIRNDAVLDTHQVFIEQTSDGRENDRIHFVAGTTEEAKHNVDKKQDSLLVHIGSVREYLNSAESLSYNLDATTQTPRELFGYLTQLSEAYSKVTE